MVAKTASYRQHSETPDSTLFLPWWVHATDAVSVICYLCEKHLAPGILSIFEEEAGGHEQLLAYLSFLACIHDIGKLTHTMQSRMLRNVSDYSGCQLAIDPSVPECHNASYNHAAVGALILDNEGFDQQTSSLIYSHHGKPELSLKGDLKKQVILCNDRDRLLYGSCSPRAEWIQMWTEVLEASEKFSGIDKNNLPRLSRATMTTVSGLLICADWIASNQDLFPLISVTDRIDDPADFAEQRAEKGLEKLGLTKPMSFAKSSMSDLEFKERFGFLPNHVQKTVLEVLTSCEDPGLVIIEAEMGGGKTEAAFAAAEIAGCKKGCGGIYMGLPTQATANGLLSRFTAWVSGLDPQSHSFRLAHGGAALNAHYQKLIKKSVCAGEDKTDGENPDLIVNPWLAGRKQSLLSDVVLGTVDQGLMSVLMQSHFMLRLFGMAGKVVIFDEIHSFDAFTDQYIGRSLNWLASIGVPVILLSATLPECKRNQFIEAYLGGKRGGRKEKPAFCFRSDQSLSYPLVTYSDKYEVRQVSALADPRFSSRSVQIESICTDGEEEQICRIVEEKLNGGCLGIVVNTVRHAQRLGRMLKDKFQDYDVLVFHSLFTNRDRQQIEDKVLSRLGKWKEGESEADYLKRRKKLIIVGTQVLEQSLDIDFDLMISELAPIDLLLQRIGRLHRHQPSWRPETLCDPICYVIGLRDEKLSKGSVWIYGEWILRQTQILTASSIKVPDDIPTLIQKAYEKPVPEALDDPLLKTAYDLHNKNELKLKQAAKAALLKPASLRRDYPDNLYSMLSRKQERSTLSRASGVRYGMMSIEVVLMETLDETHVKLPGNADAVFDITSKLSPEQAIMVATERIKLPPALLTNPQALENVVAQLECLTQRYFACWVNENDLLRNDLIALLDTDGKIALDGHTYIYSSREGLMEI